MLEVSNEEFQALIDEALGNLKSDHAQNIKNVAILYEEEPTPEQREQNNLHSNQTLLGLYQGTPLSERQGRPTTFPDRITLFKGPLVRQSINMNQLKENIKHTLWHEIAHYYGLNHDDIAAKE